MRFAAIDVGSNAIRFLLARIDDGGEMPLIKKEILLRIPIRLGDDVFVHQRISPESSRQLVKTMAAFQNLIEAFQPLAFRACATSAMRDAHNGADIIATVKKTTGVDLLVIDGKEEAHVIFSSHVERELDPRQTYLFTDVGGGSTEVMIYSKGEIQHSASFNVGSVRMLNNAVDPEEWARMQRWLHQYAAPLQPLGIGSGGNIGRLNRMVKKDEAKPLTYKKLHAIYDALKALTIDERIRLHKLKPDRADVIVPAAEIYLAVMRWGHVGKMHVPRFGLADGLVRMMYDEYRLRQNPH